MQEAYRTQSAEMARVGHVDGVFPESWNRLHTQFEDELYFLIIALRQSIAARTLLAERGEHLPPIRNEHALTAWRDMLEHWDDPPKGKSLRAEAQWQAAKPKERGPCLSMGGTSEKLTRISGVSLPSLRADLKALRKAVGKLSEDEWDRVWMTAAEAAKLLGMDIDAFEEQSWVVLHVDFPDFGRRYQREAVEEQLSRKRDRDRTVPT